VRSYEKLGVFYLGKQYDLAGGGRSAEPLLYDSKDLVTHAVCVGMTGSGKTGLGIAMIEEAAIDGLPVLAIDPKGDLSNLLLTFPDLAPADFAAWVDASDAAAHGMTVEAFAAQQAAAWAQGLADWDQPAERIARLRAAADLRVYTPGSRAGTPLALLKSLTPPDQEDGEDAAARLASTATSLLALAGVDVAGSHSREQALLTAILAEAGAAGTPADLPWLVQQIQRPSFERIGVLDLETFFPAKERQELALRFNSVLAAPGFDVWLAGEPLDVETLLHTPDGRPRVAIVSIAHLGDAERMMVVSLLLNAVLGWTRRQSGTSSLRALIYMDEVFGYLPPVANPPSKLPLLTLLKQGRAFGVGVMLATQNPVDLDYKALSNTGTWFLGKLQTERDKARVLDGLEGVGGIDRAALDKILSGLQGRVFVMHNVHEPAPVVFETRWTLSYLRGPLGREELKRLVNAQGSTANAERSMPEAQIPPITNHQSPTTNLITDPKSKITSASTRPILPAGVREFFMPGAGAGVNYSPVLYGAARVHYTDARRGIDVVTDLQATVPITDGAVPVDWDQAVESAVAPDRLETAPGPGATFAALPAAAADPRRYAAWQRDFEQWVMRNRSLRLLAAPALQAVSRPGETEREFRIRLQQVGREKRDAAVEKLRAGYAARITRLTDKARRAEQSVAREQQQSGQQKLQTVVSLGATLFGALMGRKAVSLSTLGRATTAARGVGRALKENEDVARAGQQLENAQQDLKDLQTELDAEIATIAAPDASMPLDTIEIKAKRGAVDVRLVALAWVPEASSGGS
jgi:hypothetical protein